MTAQVAGPQRLHAQGSGSGPTPSPSPAMVGVCRHGHSHSLVCASLPRALLLLSALTLCSTVAGFGRRAVAVVICYLSWPGPLDATQLRLAVWSVGHCPSSPKPVPRAREPAWCARAVPAEVDAEACVRPAETGEPPAEPLRTTGRDPVMASVR